MKSRKKEGMTLRSTTFCIKNQKVCRFLRSIFLDLCHFECYSKFIGGDAIDVIVFFIISIFISNQLVSYICILKKCQYVQRKNTNSFVFTNIISKCIPLKNYFNIIQDKLENLENPYKITVKSYFFQKYFLSPSITVISYYCFQNIIMSILLFFSMFFIFDFFIYLYEKREENILIQEILQLTQNLILSLSIEMNLYDALLSCATGIQYKRLYKAYLTFVHQYKMYHFNFVNLIEEFEKKFHSYDVKMLLTVLLEGQKEGKYIALLENLEKTLELRVLKYEKQEYTKKLIFTIFSITVVLINCFFVVGYPIIYEITMNFTKIFK